MINQNYHLELELKELEQEHGDLNEIIDAPDCQEKFSQFTLQKLKKRKLLIKDKIKIVVEIKVFNQNHRKCNIS